MQPWSRDFSVERRRGSSSTSSVPTSGRIAASGAFSAPRVPSTRRVGSHAPARSLNHKPRAIELRCAVFSQVLVQGVGDAFEVSPLVAADTIPASVLTLIGVGLRDECPFSVPRVTSPPGRPGTHPARHTGRSGLRPLGDRLRACLPDDGSH